MIFLYPGSVLESGYDTITILSVDLEDRRYTWTASWWLDGRSSDAAFPTIDAWMNIGWRLRRDAFSG